MHKLTKKGGNKEKHFRKQDFPTNFKNVPFLVCLFVSVYNIGDLIFNKTAKYQQHSQTQFGMDQNNCWRDQNIGVTLYWQHKR